MHVPSLIERKREGNALTENEIREIIAAFTDGTLPDYQMSALAMAIFFQGMDDAETTHLTRAMMESGSVLQYPEDAPPRVDKHSTGGVGDKVSLILAPLLACDELWVPMISGRGLGITGGTLDKLESFPGFSVSLDEPAALKQLQRLGVVMIGQTANICPADKKLYALRDVTGTVPSQPLITASIMSKKLAENLNRLVLDVKFGTGAFMKTRPEAESLAGRLSAIGTFMGVQMHTVLTPMSEPLGCTVGNALEVAEAVETLQGGGPSDLRNLTLDLAEKVSNVSRDQLARWLNDGTAWKKWVQLVEAQGGDAKALESMRDAHKAPVIHTLEASSSGAVQTVDAGIIGLACVMLGAGRNKATDPIDFAVGCDQIVKTRTPVAKGDPLLRLHARSQSSLEELLPSFQSAITIA